MAGIGGNISKSTGGSAGIFNSFFSDNLGGISDFFNGFRIGDFLNVFRQGISADVEPLGQNVFGSGQNVDVLGNAELFSGMVERINAEIKNFGGKFLEPLEIFKTFSAGDFLSYNSEGKFPDLATAITSNVQNNNGGGVGSPVFNFSFTINANNPAEFEAAIPHIEESFEEKMTAWLEEQRRKSFSW